MTSLACGSLRAGLRPVRLTLLGYASLRAGLRPLAAAETGRVSGAHPARIEAVAAYMSISPIPPIPPGGIPGIPFFFSGLSAIIASVVSRREATLAAF